MFTPFEFRNMSALSDFCNIKLVKFLSMAQRPTVSPFLNYHHHSGSSRTIMVDNQPMSETQLQRKEAGSEEINSRKGLQLPWLHMVWQWGAAVLQVVFGKTETLNVSAEKLKQSLICRWSMLRAMLKKGNHRLSTTWPPSKLHIR